MSRSMHHNQPVWIILSDIYRERRLPRIFPISDLQTPDLADHFGVERNIIVCLSVDVYILNNDINRHFYVTLLEVDGS